VDVRVDPVAPIPLFASRGTFAAATPAPGQAATQRDRLKSTRSDEARSNRGTAADGLFFVRCTHMTKESQIVHVTAGPANRRPLQTFRRQVSIVNREPCEGVVRLQAEVRR
jgi:hypothetical protein